MIQNFELNDGNIDPPPSTQGQTLPDIDDINGFVKLAPLNNDPPQGTPIGFPLTPDNFSADDKQLILIGTEDLDPGPNVLLQYELESSWEVDFGIRQLDIFNGDNIVPPAGDQLTLTVRQGTDYLVEYEGTTPDSPAEFIFSGIAEQDVFFTYGGREYPALSYSQTGDSEQDPDVANISDWVFQAEAIFEQPSGITEGEAFSYAESTAALDLNGDDNLIPVPTEVL